MESMRSGRVLTVVGMVVSVLGLACGDVQGTEEPKYKITRDLTSGHVDLWARHLAHLAGKPDVRGLEIGSYEGMSTVWFLQNVLTHDSARMVNIDPYARENYHWNIEASGAAHKVTFHKEYSEPAMRKFEMHSFDFVYIDGSHHAKDVLIDAVQSWSLIKVGGLIIFDDYTMKSDKWGVPKPAIDCFLDIFGPYLEIVSIGESSQVIVRKKVEHLDPPPRTWDDEGNVVLREG